VRKRPWLIACLMLVFIGTFVVVTSPGRGLEFWAGAMAILAGILTAIAGYLSQRPS
jgi:hypothetical protein